MVHIVIKRLLKHRQQTFAAVSPLLVRVVVRGGGTPFPAANSLCDARCVRLRHEGEREHTRLFIICH